MEYYKPLDMVHIHKADKYHRPNRLERAIRLYCIQRHAAWTLQIRGPLGIGFAGHKDGKDDVIAGATLTREGMMDLRNQIDAALKEEQAC